MPHKQKPEKEGIERKPKLYVEDRQNRNGKNQPAKDVEDRPQSNENQRQGNAREDADEKSRKDTYPEEF